MSDVRIYAAIPTYVSTEGYVREVGQVAYLSLGEYRKLSATKAVWAVVPSYVLYQDSHSCRLSEEVGGWRDLTEEDLQVFTMEEKLAEGRVQRIQLNG
jgi:hypothetical protein